MITVASKKSTNNSCQTLPDGMSTHERVMQSTMSVDEYFDELIDQVRQDYAAL